MNADSLSELPKISVVTVCLNSVETLDDSLRSVQAQSWPSIEHIVIDGGSRDGTVELLSQYEGQLAHVVSEPDRGIYDAMNKGLALASGDIVCFLNADDVYAHNDVLSRVAGEMESGGLDALLGDVVFFRPDAPEKVVRYYRSDRFSPQRLAYGWMPAHPALFLRRGVFERVGGFRTDYRIAGDFEFIARAFGKGNLRYRHLPEVLVRMRVGGVSTAGLRNTLLLNREVLRACKENGIRTNMPKLLMKYPVKFVELFRTTRRG